MIKSQDERINDFDESSWRLVKKSFRSDKLPQFYIQIVNWKDLSGWHPAFNPNISEHINKFNYLPINKKIGKRR